MKKQLLIAAVAATMATASMADISIKGSANIKMAGKDLSTNTFTTQSSSQNMDVDITGSNGATKVIAHLDIDNASSLVVLILRLMVVLSMLISYT